MKVVLNWGKVAVALFLNCLTVYYILALFMEFTAGYTETVTVMTFAGLGFCVFLIFLRILYSILSESVSDRGFHSKMIRCLDIACLVLFFVYFGCFVISTVGMERGSDLYMLRLFPGFIPLLSRGILFL